MKAKSVTEKLYEAINPIVENLGLTLWDIRYEKEGANKYLRVYIDKPDSIIDISDCERVTEPVSKLLDELDPIAESYIFEVSSTGLGRTLRTQRHLQACVGKEIRLGLYKAVDGSKEYEGILESVGDDDFTVDGKTFKLNECTTIKLNDDKDLF